MSRPVQLRTARDPDWNSIVALLRQCQLPVEDLVPAMLPDFLVAEDAGRLAGVVGCEPRGDCTLFRSLAVAPEHRGRGLAAVLAAELERRAKAGGAKTAYLLTRTAERFAEKRGFRAVPRESAPDAIRGTAEFRHVCCAAARCMAKEL